MCHCPSKDVFFSKGLAGPLDWGHLLSHPDDESTWPRSPGTAVSRARGLFTAPRAQGGRGLPCPPTAASWGPAAPAGMCDLGQGRVPRLAQHAALVLAFYQVANEPFFAGNGTFRKAEVAAPLEQLPGLPAADTREVGSAGPASCPRRVSPPLTQAMASTRKGELTGTPRPVPAAGCPRVPCTSPKLSGMLKCVRCVR